MDVHNINHDLDSWLSRREKTLCKLLSDGIENRMGHRAVHDVYDVYDAGHYRSWNYRLDQWLDEYSALRKSNIPPRKALFMSAHHVSHDMMMDYYLQKLSGVRMDVL